MHTGCRDTRMASSRSSKLPVCPNCIASMFPRSLGQPTDQDGQAVCGEAMKVNTVRAVPDLKESFSNLFVPRHLVQKKLVLEIVQADCQVRMVGLVDLRRLSCYLDRLLKYMSTLFPWMCPETCLDRPWISSAERLPSS